MIFPCSNIIHTTILCNTYPDLLFIDNFAKKVSFDKILPTPSNFQQEFIEYDDIYACSTQEKTKQYFIKFLTRYYYDDLNIKLIGTKNGYYFADMEFKDTASKRNFIINAVNKFINKSKNPNSEFYHILPSSFRNDSSKANTFLIREKRLLLAELFCATFANVSHIGIWRQMHWGTPFDVIDSHYDNLKKELLLVTIDNASIVLNELIQSNPDTYTLLSQKNRLNSN